MPIAGVQVAIVKPIQKETKTDDRGNFTFNELAPGAYALIFSRLGYEEGQRKADVVAGEVSSVGISLVALVLSDEPYHVAYPRTAFFNADSDLINYLQYGWGVNSSQVNELRCDRCTFVYHIEASPAAVLSEPVWASEGAAYNNQICYTYQKNWTDAPAGSQGNVKGGCLDNKQQAAWAKEEVKALKGIDKVRLLVNGGLLAVQWRVDVWTTFGYNGDLPEDYSALPPA